MSEKSPKWQLANVEERQAKDPKTFEIPSRALRDQLRSGDAVKLIFEFVPEDDGCSAERMWVAVIGITKRPEGPIYMGKLENRPVCLAEHLKLGDKIVFGPEHVADVEH